jgi:hypothetical protein
VLAGFLRDRNDLAEERHFPAGTDLVGLKPKIPTAEWTDWVHGHDDNILFVGIQALQDMLQVL